MTDITITQADREAAARLVQAAPLVDNPDIIRLGGADDSGFVQAFAAHRLSAIEEAANVAEQQSEVNARARIDRADDELAFEFRGLGNVIATAIRALAQPPVAKDIRKMREG